MKQVTLSIVLGIFVLCTSHVSRQAVDSPQERKSSVHISFIPPLSTNGTRAGEYTNTFSLNLLAGISKNEKAFTLEGLTNIIRNNSSGFQLAGLGNYVGNEGNGMLFSGLTNIVKNTYSGLQFAGLANISGNTEGCQFAGLINIAQNVKGIQLAGLLNIANRSDYPIGLINIIKEGEMSIAVGYNEIGTAGITFRSGGKVTYGILGVGYNHKTQGDALAISGGLGAHINVNSWFRVNNELTGETFGNFSDKTSFKVGYALMPAFKIGQHIELFGGPSINYMQTNDEKDHKIFPSNSLWKKERASKLQQVYIGYRFGVQYIF